uniref:ribosomal protein S7 n=1 Tax=Haslea karadagensis TaxID=1146996 RepID=UPI00220A2B71|nr:ribosomal protein S7 [Haslea karadagensis]UXN44277.1 ribosomal protein S7 [Haslea karadagensis]
MKFKNSLEKKLKYKIMSHFMIKGKKATCEKILVKGLKRMQKLYTKSHSEITKIAILNVTPIFRVIQLQEKRKKKKKKGAKRAKEVPAFLSHYNFRTSWALKLLLDSLKKRSKNKRFSEELLQEIIAASQNSGESVQVKIETQKTVLKKKFYFKYYRW